MAKIGIITGSGLDDPKIFSVEKETSVNLLLNSKMHEEIKSSIRTIPDWPKKGIMFRDITTLLKDPKSFKYTINILKEKYSKENIDIIAGIESRGFIIGAALAYALNKGFVLLRKKGKLPAETEREEYILEYGTDCIEIHKDAIHSGMNVLLVDDLLATGGTALAACKLIKKLGGNISECCFVIDLPDLNGRKKLEDNGYRVYSITEFEGE